jgi:predicted porin
MRTKILVVALLSSFASLSFAASNVTLYGQLDEGLVVGKAKHSSTTATLKSGFVGMSRWGIKGVEDLGNGYSVGFTLEQGFLADSGAEHTSGLAFSRESLMRITGPFGQVAFGRMGALGFAQSTAILRGWAFGTSWGASAWSVGNVHFGRLNNAVNYVTPSFSGLTLHATYSNGTAADDNKWSDNAHYYGVGAKYTAHNIDASIIFEAKDNKGVALLEEKQKALYHITAGGTYNFNGVKPGVIYQYATQEDYYHQHAFGLSVTALWLVVQLNWAPSTFFANTTAIMSILQPSPKRRQVFGLLEQVMNIHSANAPTFGHTQVMPMELKAGKTKLM